MSRSRTCGRKFNLFQLAGCRVSHYLFRTSFSHTLICTLIWSLPTISLFLFLKLSCVPFCCTARASNHPFFTAHVFPFFCTSLYPQFAPLTLMLLISLFLIYWWLCIWIVSRSKFHKSERPLSLSFETVPSEFLRSSSVRFFTRLRLVRIWETWVVSTGWTLFKLSGIGNFLFV